MCLMQRSRRSTRTLTYVPEQQTMLSSCRQGCPEATVSLRMPTPRWRMRRWMCA